jgi:chromosome segregation ATPase
LENRYRQLSDSFNQLEEERARSEGVFVREQKELVQERESLAARLQESFNELIKKDEKLSRCELELKALQKRLDEKEKQVLEATSKMCSMDYDKLFDDKRSEF